MKHVQVKSLKKSETSLSQVSSHLTEVQVRSWIIWNKSKSGLKSSERSPSQVSQEIWDKFKSSLKSYDRSPSQVRSQLKPVQRSAHVIYKRLSQVSSQLKSSQKSVETSLRSVSVHLRYAQVPSIFVICMISTPVPVSSAFYHLRMSVLRLRQPVWVCCAYLWGRVESRPGWRDWTRSCCSCGLESRSEID